MTKRSILSAAFILIRQALLFSGIFLLVACNGPKSKHKSTIRHPVDSVSDKSADTSATIAKGALTQENSLAFLTNYCKHSSENEVVIHTKHGNIKIRLFRNTPLHRANFLYLTHKKYFDGTWFYRVSEGHVIQAGNNDAGITGKKRAAIGDYKIPSEISAGNLHHRGAVAAARSYYQNPEKSSTPFEFYIVLGKEYSTRQLKLLADKEGFALTESQIKAYESTAGSPHLDSEHTVFGEVVAGMAVVEAISRVKTDEGEWPLESIPILVEVVK